MKSKRRIEIKTNLLADIIAHQIQPIPACKAIRQICYACKDCNWSEVSKCTIYNCPNWQHRFGKNPFSKRGISQTKDKNIRENFQSLQISIQANGIEKKVQDNPIPPPIGICLVAKTDNATSTPLRAKSGISSKNGFSDVQIDIINFLIDAAAFFCGEFTGLDIETMKCGKFHLASYKLRQLRYLNEKYGIYQVKKGKGSRYKIIKTVDELEKLFEVGQ